MGYCQVCNSAEGIPFTCNECGGKFCSEHRLPENHNCRGITRSPDVARDGSVIAPTTSSSKSTENYDDISYFWLPIGLLILAVELSYGLLQWLLSSSGLKVISIGLIALLTASATIGTGYAPLDSTVSTTISDVQSVVEEPITEDLARSPATSHEDGSTAGSVQTQSPPDATSRNTNGIDRAQIEQQVHYFVNQERKERGLRSLEFDDNIREIARYHSEDMPEQGYFAHTAPDGETLGDRYDKFGYECRVPISDNEYSTGAENIAYTYAYTTIVADNGSSINHQGNETSIARGVVNQWMNSSGHRNNILKPYWQSEGIGVAVAEIDGQIRIYATQNFC